MRGGKEELPEYRAGMLLNKVTTFNLWIKEKVIIEGLEKNVFS